LTALLAQLDSYAKNHGLSKKQLAGEVGIPYSTLQKWLAESESRRDPSRENTAKIQRFLQLKTQATLNMLETTTDSFTKSTSSTERSGKGDSMSPSKVTKRYRTAIRDPIHRDISLTPLEIRVIDTEAFQRLRHIKQLGTASLVYPGATHTRFDHSIGTVAAAQMIINAVNNNPNTQRTIDTDTEDIIRMCALLHDVTHVPFGHTLEDEGFLYPRHDRTGKGSRWDIFLGPSSEIGQVLINEVSEKFRQEIVRNLTAKAEEINQLERPFIADIVGNTICADLLDYLARDTYYVGLKEAYDPRFLTYLLIASDQKYKDRLVLSVLKNDRMRRDVVSEVLHMLRLRYSLAEKVYYHHAKIITSAMVIAAVQAAIMNDQSNWDEEAICNLAYGDQELLSKLRECGERRNNALLTKLAKNLSIRSLYKPVYMLTYSAPSPEDPSRDKKAAINKRFRENWKKRFDSERRLERWNRLEEGSVIIHCPTEEMNLKQIETLCLWRDQQILKLTEIPGGRLEGEAKSINDAHKELWKMYVFVERGLRGEREIMQNLASTCFYEFEQLSNRIESLSEVGMPPLERYIEEWAKFSGTGVTIEEKNQLIWACEIARGDSTAGPPSYDALEKHLKDLRTGSS